MDAWYAVHTHARAEEKARFNLNRQGFATYLPRYLKRRAHARRVEMVPAPLFPRYLFVRLDTEISPWHCLRSTIGVDHVVGFDGRPAEVPGGIIDGIRRRENEQGYVEEPDDRLSGPVRIGDGPLRDVEAIFVSGSDAERVVVLMELMGRTVRASVPRRLVSAL